MKLLYIFSSEDLILIEIFVRSLEDRCSEAGFWNKITETLESLISFVFYYSIFKCLYVLTKFYAFLV